MYQHLVLVFDINGTLDVDGDLQVDDLNVSGVSTFASLVDVNNRIDVVGGANIDQLNVTGVSTFGDDVTVEGELFVASNIKHQGDSDTYIEFTGDQMRFIAGGKPLIHAEEASTDTVIINDGGNNLDFRVESLNDEYLIFSDGTLEKVGIGVSVPGAKLDVGGTLNVTGVATFASDVNITGLLEAGAIDGGSY